MDTSIEPLTHTAGDAPLATRAGRGSLLGVVGIFALTVACHVPLLGSAPLAGTEGHRVLPALEMVRNGDWILPRLFGQLYLMKPPLHYWILAATQLLVRGHGNEFIWRMPSVIMAALLNVTLYLFGARWFGRTGGIVSGLCGLGLLALWGQARTADIDATNTLASTLTALCLIELCFGFPRRRWVWIAGGGLAFGATLMTKGPAGLPIIAGVLLWVVVDARQNREPGERWDVLRSAGTWMPLLIGAALFALWATLAWLGVHRLHLRPDYGGLEETGKTVVLHKLSRVGLVLALPFQVFAFSMPVSLALPLVLLPGYRRALGISGEAAGLPRFQLARALACSVLLSWLVCLLSGMTNPRYGYVTIPPLCLLAGALVASLPFQSESCSSFLRGVSVGSVVVLIGANWLITALAWKGGIGRPVLLVGVMLATILGVSTFRRLAVGPAWRGAWAMPCLLLLLAVPFAYQFRLERLDRSGFQASRMVRDYIGDSDAPVLVGSVAHSQPELFYYAGLHPQVTPTFALQNPDRYPGDEWVFLDEDEYARWMHLAPDRLSRVKRFISHKYKGYILWYSRRPMNAATSGPSIVTTQPAPVGSAAR